MFPSLKNHPFAVEAFFESSLVLAFAVPKEQLMSMIPECLQLDTFKDKWAFIAVAMVQTKNLRIKGFPKIFGNDFFLIGYRIFVKFISNKGKKLRGLCILKSETNSKKMEFFGNLFTHYKYTTTDITLIKNELDAEIQSSQSDFRIVIENKIKNVSLPLDSPFSNWKEARKFAGPLPFTFTYDSALKRILIIQGVRQNWKPEPINVIDYKISFLDSLDLDEVTLANAFEVKNIPYFWKKGRTEQWKG